MIQTVEEAIPCIERVLEEAAESDDPKILTAGWSAALETYSKAERKAKMGRMLIAAAQAMEQEMIAEKKNTPDA